MKSHTVPEDARMEIKFVAHHSHAHTLLHWLRMHPSDFRVAHPDRWVNSLYFDTHDSLAYMENILGSSSRAKVRYRWYGEKRLPGPGALEVKRKRNLFGWKLRYEVGRAPSWPGASWREILNSLEEQLPPSGRAWLRTSTVPTLINRYHRKYFLTADGLIRATVDTRQMAWDQRFSSVPELNRRQQIADTVVVEFKFDRRERDAASRVMQGIPVRMSRHSKYISGLEAVHRR